MRRFVDLHTHSIASDGQLSPAEVIRLADRNNLAAVALTDHDTVDGLAEAAQAAASCPEMRFVPGIEVSAKYPVGCMHILGLGVDAAARELGAMCENLRASRRERNPKMIAKLQALGLAITLEEVEAAAARLAAEAAGRTASAPAAGGKQVLGRLHMADALRRKGFVSSTAEAFSRYLGAGRPAYVDKERLDAAYIIETIRQAGGVAILAHPPQLLYENRAQLERVLRDLIGHGLGGIEVYHTDNSVEQTRLYLDFARRYGLIVSGGSDYHGPAKVQSRIGNPRVPLAAIGEDVLDRLTRKPR